MAVNLGQISAIAFGPTAPTNTRILWLADGELIPRYWDGANWVPLNSTGPYSEYPDTDPTTIGNPPAGGVFFGWDDPDGLWYKDDAGDIVFLDDISSTLFTVATVADRNALTDVKKDDRCIVTSDADLTANREYVAQVDNPLSTQWLAVPLANWQDTPVDGTPYVRLDRTWIEGVTKTALDISLDDYIKKDGSVPFDAPYIPTNPQDAATKGYVDTELLNKEDYLGLPATSGQVLTSDTAGNRSWTDKTVDTDEFIQLTDTPASYLGSANQWLRVDPLANEIIFDTLPPFVTDFLSLTDTPGTFAGSAGLVATVNATETGLEFTAAAGAGNLLSDGSIPMDPIYTPAPGSQDIATANYVDAGLALKEDSLGNPAIDGQTLVSTAAGVRSWVTRFDETFLSLSDTPGAYVANQDVVVNVGGTGIEFIPKVNPGNTFVGLADSPANYTGAANQFVRVDPTESFLVFSDEVGVGNLLSDGSVPMDAGWVPVLPEDLVDKKYVDSIVISGNLLSDGSIPMDAGWSPTNPQDLPTYQTVQDWAALVRVSEGVPAKEGWRLWTSNPLYHGDVGEESVDLMFSSALVLGRGALGDYSVTMGEDTLSLGRSSMAVNRLTQANADYTFTAVHESIANGIGSIAMGWGQTATPVQTDADYSAIIGGQSGTLGNLAENSVMLGGDSMTGNMPDMVYVPGVKWLPTTQPLAPEDGAMYYDQSLQQFLYWDDTIPAWRGLSAGPPGAVNSFIGLPDTPLSYAGAANQVPVVNVAENALEFRPRSFGSVFVIPVGTILGFNIGDAVAWDGTGWIHADTSDDARSAQGIIQFADTTQSTVYISGEITWIGHGLTVGEWYWLDDTGAYVTPAPDQVLVQTVFFIKDANTVIVDVTRPLAKEDFANLLWTALGDTPGSYGGFVGHVPIVNSTEDGLVFTELPGLNRALGTYTYNNAAPPPALQEFRMDNADPTLATTCSIDYTNLEGLDVTGYLNILAIGSYLSFVDAADPLNTILYQIDTLTDNVTFITYGITVIGVTGTITNLAVFALENIGAQIDAITQFIDMNDTPASYVGNSGKVVVVNTAEDAVEFVDPLVSSIVAIRYEFNATAGQTVITLAEAVDANMTLSINGLTISQTQYTVLGNDITMVTPLAVDDLIILTNYEPAAPVERFEQLASAGQTNFTLVNNVSGLAIVTVNGLAVSNTTYTSLANVLTFNTPLVVNDLVIITNYL